jgi:DNA-directed RNA polymerase specialized sigma24 family protein
MDSGATALDHRLSHITPRARQAFLLISLEGFSEIEAANVLGIDLPTLRHLAEEAGREMGRADRNRRSHHRRRDAHRDGSRGAG